MLGAHPRPRCRLTAKRAEFALSHSEPAGLWESLTPAASGYREQAELKGLGGFKTPELETFLSVNKEGKSRRSLPLIALCFGYGASSHVLTQRIFFFL